MKKLNSNFVFFILLMFFSLLVIFSSLFFKKLMLTGSIHANCGLCNNKIANFSRKNTTNSFLACQNLTPQKPTQTKFSSVDTSPIFCKINNLQSEPTANFYEINEYTPLYKTTTDDPQNLAGIYFILPKTYFVEVLNSQKLDSGEDGLLVRYNGYEGYCKQSALGKTPTQNSQTQSGITLKMYSDAGTYIRQTPEIADNKIRIIPQSTTNIIFIGTINGDTPTDGTTNVWYFVEYNISDTKTVLGYIYSERAILSSPLTERPQPITESTEQSTTTPTLSATEKEKLPTTSLNLSASPTLKWIIALLFIIPIVIIFTLLIKKPRKTSDFIENFANSPQNSTNYPTDEDLIPEFCDTKSTNKPKAYKFSKEINPFVKFSTTMETANELTPNTNPQDNFQNNQTQKMQKNSKNTSNFAKNYQKNDNFTINPPFNNNLNPNCIKDKNLSNNSSLPPGNFTINPSFNNSLNPDCIKDQNLSNNSSLPPGNFTLQNSYTNQSSPKPYCKKTKKPLLSLLGFFDDTKTKIKPATHLQNSAPKDKAQTSTKTDFTLENSYNDYYENITNKRNNLKHQDILSAPKFPKINIDADFEFSEDFSISPTISSALFGTDNNTTHSPRPRSQK